MAFTLPLTDGWDITLDPAGNLRLTDPDTSTAQDVASAVRTFRGECWYAAGLGLPYFEQILGQRPPRSLLVDQIKQAALTVPDVTSASVTFLGLRNRALTGAVLVTRAPSSTPLTVTF